MMIEPLKERVLGVPFKLEEKTASGIYMPDKETQSLRRCTIVAVGEEMDIKPPIKIGDVIYYQSHNGVDMEGDDGTKYILLAAGSLQARYHKEVTDDAGE